MRFLGFLLLLAGWTICLTAVVLLNRKAFLGVFVLAGVAVECLGLVFVSRSHAIVRETAE
jgi:hypothetical protein